MAGSKFVNPYNFFPLKKESPKRLGIPNGKYSGVIEYSLLTKTPLFIPNTSSEQVFDVVDKDHKTYDFFSYNDLSLEGKTLENTFFEPVIPGSEIRGMLRGYYEILTNSCLSEIDVDETLSKRTGETFSAGLLKKASEKEYVLLKAEDCIMRTIAENCLIIPATHSEGNGSWVKSYIQKDLMEGEKVFVEVVDRGKNIKPLVKRISKEHARGTKPGYVVKGEPSPWGKTQKHNCHIFIEKGGEIRELKQQELETMDTVLGIYKNNGVSIYAEYKEAWGIFKEAPVGTFFPVYYRHIKAYEYIMLAPACYTREVYKKKIKDLIGEHHTKHCNVEEGFCPACALFGKLGTSTRIRVADLRLKEWKANEDAYKGIFEKPYVCPPLGEPKINNMEFYVKRPADDAWFWTYDYYIDSKGSLRPCTPEINGRKFYWHHTNVSLSDHKTADRLNSTIRPIKSGIGFEGKIFFERLTKEELDTLIYALNAGDDNPIDKKAHGQKVGKAKSLGLGSIAMQVDRVVCRDVLVNESQKKVMYNLNEYTPDIPAIDREIAEGFEKITNFDALEGKIISYPKADRANRDGEYPVYEWFVANHSAYLQPNARRPMPQITDMPNKRTQQFYREYMYALEPDLRPTGAPPVGTVDKRNSKGKKKK